MKKKFIDIPSRYEKNQYFIEYFSYFLNQKMNKVKCKQ